MSRSMQYLLVVVLWIPFAHAKEKEIGLSPFINNFIRTLCMSNYAENLDASYSCVSKTKEMALKQKLSTPAIALHACNMEYADLFPLIEKKGAKPSATRDQRERTCLYQARDEISHLDTEESASKSLESNLKKCQAEIKNTSRDSVCIKRAFEESVSK